MRLSVVTTLYCSSEFVEEFCRRAKEAAAEITPDYEIVFVNDGSPDDSLAKAIALCRRDSRVKTIDLSRNFGHHKAMMTGLAHARGDLVFLIDSDLEEEPETLKVFYDEFRKHETDVVYGVQKKRKGNGFERFSGEIYYKFFNLLTGYNAPANVLTARLMTADYVRALVAHQEQEFDIMGLWSLTGFRQSSVAVVKSSKGSSAYSVRRKIALFINTVTAFSNRPLLAMFAFGLLIFAAATLAAFYYAVKHLFFAEVENWKLISVSVWLLGGILITCLGTLGIYISKIYIETKRRPYTIIRRIYGGEANE